MTALRANTARLVLDRVSQDDRAQVVEQVANALDATSAAADVGFAATLLQLQPSEKAKSVILAHLKALVVRGDHALATAVCRDHVQLKGDVFAALAEAVSSTATMLQASGHKWITVPVSSMKESKAASGMGDESDDVLTRRVDEAVNGLQFVVRMEIPLQDESSIRALLEACIVLIGSEEKRLSAAAQEVLYHALLLPAQSSSVISQKELWARIQSLTSASDAFYKTVGFSLWLRWSISANPPALSVLSQSEYWSLIVDGLGRGDGERRKAALQILRSSVQLALQDSSLVSMVATASAHDQSKFEGSVSVLHIDSGLRCQSVARRRNLHYKVSDTVTHC